MLNLLYAFGIGLMFAAGVISGALMYHSAAAPKLKLGGETESEKWDKHRENVETRLKKSADANAEIAASIGKIAEKYLSKKDMRGANKKSSDVSAKENS